MSRRDPGAATGGTIREPRRCRCGRMETLHPLKGGRRGGFPAAGCKQYEPASNVIAFPGAGMVPAPAGPPTPMADLDAIGDRWTELLEARHRGDAQAVRLLEAACAEDVPVLREELHRVDLLRQELAAELDRVTGR